MAAILILRLAEKDFEKATRWYFKRSPGTAYRFSDAFDAALNAIEADPLRYAPVDHRHRSIEMKPFPYSVFYRIDRDAIKVVAVAHAKRRPGFWRRRAG